MDPRTEELVQRLHRSPHDPVAMKDVREHLTNTGRHRSLAKLLEWWSKKAPTDEDAANALLDASEALSRAGGETERVAEVLRRALERYPAHEAASERVEQVLTKAGMFVELAAVLEKQSVGLIGSIGQARLHSAVLCRLAVVRRDHLKDVDGAIDALAQAAAVDGKNVDALYDLASLYVDRAEATTGARAEADRRQAADLYYRIADSMGGEESLQYLDAALALAPDHEVALTKLEDLSSSAERQAELPMRWVAFITLTSDRRAEERRRVLLSNAYARNGQLDDAIKCLEPIASRGVKKAEGLISAYREVQRSGPAPALKGPRIPALRTALSQPPAGHDPLMSRVALLEELAREEQVDRGGKDRISQLPGEPRRPSRPPIPSWDEDASTEVLSDSGVMPLEDQPTTVADRLDRSGLDAGSELQKGAFQYGEVATSPRRGPVDVKTEQNRTRADATFESMLAVPEESDATTLPGREPEPPVRSRGAVRKATYDEIDSLLDDPPTRVDGRGLRGHLKGNGAEARVSSIPPPLPSAVSAKRSSAPPAAEAKAKAKADAKARAQAKAAAGAKAKAEAKAQAKAQAEAKAEAKAAAEAKAREARKAKSLAKTNGRSRHKPESIGPGAASFLDGADSEPPMAFTRSMPTDGLGPIFEDDDDDAPFVPPFSVDVILGEQDKHATPVHDSGGASIPVVEVTRAQGDAILDSVILRGPLARYKRPGVPLVVRKRGAVVTVKVPSDVDGWVVRTWGGPDARRQRLPEGDVELAIGDVAEIDDGLTRHRVRYVKTKRPELTWASPAVMKRDLKRFLAASGGAVVVHAVVLLSGIAMLGTAGVELKVEDRPREEIFAEARLKPEPPKPETPRPVRPRRVNRSKAKEPPEPNVKIPKSLRRRLRNIAQKRVARNASAAERAVSALTSPVKGEGQTLKDVVSNIDAVRGGEATGAHKIGGTLAALEGSSSVNIASGGGGDLGTLGGEQATENVTKLTARKTGKVRGRVSAMRALARVQGSLTPGEVMSVLNRAMGRIQGCYERALTRNPSLGGRLSFDWTVKPNGRVSGVRERASTLADRQVSSCIARVLRGLRFPKPRGGPVDISFPFIFRRAS